MQETAKNICMLLDRKLRRERREWLDSVKTEERRMESKRRKEQLYKSYERDVVVPREIRNDIEDEKLTAEEALQDAIYAFGPEEKEDEFTKAESRPVITTSRSPSAPLIRFAKMLKHILPSAEKINRGKHMIKELVQTAIKNNHTDLIMVNEHRGIPSSLIISHLPHGPTTYFSIHHPKIDTEEPISTAVPAVVFDNFTTPLGKRVQRILSSLFPALTPREKPKRVVSFINREDSILFTHFKTSFTKGEPSLQKQSPQFTLKLYEIRAGTLDMTYAEKEFVFRPYLNTARKKLYLGEETDDITTEEAKEKENQEKEKEKDAIRDEEAEEKREKRRSFRDHTKKEGKALHQQRRNLVDSKQ
ncbi:U3 small nucleolar ribonucleoprotein IMP4 [Nematocida minor]|uniref:U3 small nucleolar ribonucleoprotein IMP4 n=1 Tax=Nematocida minor TaxID=1912983 RepID=UPI00221F2FE3|nr:U3 small nucleolar ribonucleoprotein IMP4 [Nematocida minor]KAI5191906.1 U3 small nucleolar ribonucleoprotein IMP4 [Nematocida minor]